MYTRILMTADYEPWWQFEGIEEKYTEVIQFDTYEEYEKDTLNVLDEYRNKYENEALRNDIYYAFWNEGEVFFCEGCDEDLQVFYGIILSHPIRALVK